MSSGDSVWTSLDWDTAFFGVKVARILPTRPQPGVFAQALNACQTWGAQVVYYLADSDSDQAILLAEATGFHLVDLRLTLEWTARETHLGSLPQGILLRDHRENDLEALQQIARNVYHHTRYYHDQRFDRERCDALYAEWIARSCHSPSQQVLVAERAGDVIGYITYHLQPDTQMGEIGLVGLRADAQGQGIGQLLVVAAQDWFHTHQARRVSVVTQGRNIGAQRLYQRCGFVTSSVQCWYHAWFDNPPPA